MRSTVSFGTVLGVTALLLPSSWTAAESQLVVETRGRSSATAHVAFRIIIPATLSLDLAAPIQAGLRPVGAQAVAIQPVIISSSNRTVTLGASTSDSSDGRRPPVAKLVILNAAAHKVVAQEAACALATDTAIRRMVCTVAMP